MLDPLDPSAAILKLKYRFKNIWSRHCYSTSAGVKAGVTWARVTHTEFGINLPYFRALVTDSLNISQVVRGSTLSTPVKYLVNRSLKHGNIAN